MISLTIEDIKEKYPHLTQEAATRIMKAVEFAIQPEIEASLEIAYDLEIEGN